MRRFTAIAVLLLIGLRSSTTRADPALSPSSAEQAPSAEQAAPETPPPAGAGSQAPAPEPTPAPSIDWQHAWRPPPPVDAPSPPTTQAPTGASADSMGASADSQRDQERPDAVPEGEAPEDDGQPVTGTLRGGVYADSDRTTVLRALGVVAHSWEHWALSGSLGVDSVTSASVDVRSSPALSKVDVITSASGRSSTSGGKMTDTRFQATGTIGWKGGSGAAVNLTTAAAKERDYASVSGGLNGSVDVLDRSITLLGGAALTDNWVSSVLDASLHRKMLAPAWSAGAAFVLTPDDALRLRYDGKASEGYQSSPYRSVRFGDWTARLGTQQITFMNTIGSAAGLPEHVPESRVSHAAVLEWLHSLGPDLGLHPELRVSRDTWSIESLSAGVDLRVAAHAWRLQAGYRFYLQSKAYFFQDKYIDAPAAYPYYSSDKELGDEVGHLVRLDLAFVLSDAYGPNESRALLNLQLEGAHYKYPGFVLLPSRDSIFAGLGITWEL